MSLIPAQTNSNLSKLCDSVHTSPELSFIAGKICNYFSNIIVMTLHVSTAIICLATQKITNGKNVHHLFHIKGNSITLSDTRWWSLSKHDGCNMATEILLYVFYCW